MIKLLKDSRLLVLFLVTIMATLGLLFYFSIVNIANYRDLLRIKVAEEQQEISVDYARYIEMVIAETSANISHAFSGENPSALQIGEFITKSKGVTDYVFSDASGTLKRPFVTSFRSSVAQFTSNKKFQSQVVLGEASEFKDKNLELAEIRYSRALTYAKARQDSAHIYNLLSRTSFKRSEIDRSIRFMDSLINNYSEEVSNSGFPYVYFAIDRVLNLDIDVYPERQYDLIIDFLNHFEDNKIPFNINTADIFESIESRLELLNGEHSQEIKQLLDKSGKLLKLYQDYRYLHEQNFYLDHTYQDTVVDMVPYMTFYPDSDDFREALLFYPMDRHGIGLVFNIDSLNSAFSEVYDPDKFSFEFNIAVREKLSAGFLNNEGLQTFTDFSPVFRNTVLEIGLSDRFIIDKKVRNRKISFGIGLTLFLSILGLGVYLLIKDINRETRLNRLRADFVSRVTHELKTPLTSINMFAEALYMEQADQGNRISKYTKIIIKESEKLKNMINNILDFSKSENEKLQFALKREDLARVVNEAITDLDYFIEINNIDLTTDLEDNLYAKINMSAFKQALTNIISNAVKYSGSKKQINIVLKKELEEAVISVEDFGIGIPQEQIYRIFDRFYRVDSKYNDTVSGTGLGLTVAKAIVHAHKGVIKVESQLGKGSKFSIFIPLI